MDDFDYMGKYFSGMLSPEEMKQFDEKIQIDPAFAEQVAFYCTAMQQIKSQVAEEKKKRFREIYYQQNDERKVKQMPARKWLPYAAAAAVFFFAIISYLFFKPVSTTQLADNYINGTLQTLPVDMDNRQDSLETAISLYNQKEFAASLKIFETKAQSDNSNIEAKKYAGIVSLQSGNYDKALKYFEDLENYPGLQINSGKFYKALTLLKRNQPGDKDLAKKLLKEIVQYNLAGKKQAEDWLKKL